MPPTPSSKPPTEAELEILQVLWETGPATVRVVFDRLRTTRVKIGYTTVLKLMQIMTDKGTLTKDDSVRPQVYRPARPRKQTQKQILGNLLERAFRGSTGELVMQALSSKKATPEELAQIRELLDRLEVQEGER